MALTIMTSLNVRGLRDNVKRREVFNWLRRKQFSVYMLQEVHCIESSNHLWAAEWGYQTFLAPTVAIKQEYAFFSTTISIYKFGNFSLIHQGVSLYVTSKG